MLTNWKHVAELHILTIAICELEGCMRTVLNITAMTDQQFTAQSVETDFDEKKTNRRLERRDKNWMGNVIIED